MISITVYSKSFIKIGKGLGVLAFWITVWKAASLLVGEDLRLFLPAPEKVLLRWLALITETSFWCNVGATLLRIFLGFVLGSLCGVLCGLLTANLSPVDALLSPMMRILRAVPVVSFIILAFLFIHVDGLPVFIGSLMVLPLVWQSTHDGLCRTDVRLLEMAKMYRLGFWKTLWKIRLPQALPGMITAHVSALGLAWKSGVAAEVLCTPDVSMGHAIFTAKANLSFDEVYAVTLTIVVFSLCFEWLFRAVSRRMWGGRSQ